MALSPITWLYSLILLAGILLIFGLLLWWFSYPQSFLVKKITISGQQHSSSTAIQSTIAIYLRDKKLHELERALATLPYIKNVSVKTIWPHELQVHIDEYQAVARWANQPYTYVDVSGELFVLAGVDLALPQFVADNSCITELLRYQAQIQAMLYNHALHTLFCDSLRSWAIGLNNGMQLNLGRGDIMPRLERFVKIYHHILAHAETKLYIDLRYPNGIAVQLAR